MDTAAFEKLGLRNESTAMPDHATIQKEQPKHQLSNDTSDLPIKVFAASYQTNSIPQQMDDLGEDDDGGVRLDRSTSLGRYASARPNVTRQSPRKTRKAQNAEIEANAIDETYKPPHIRRKSYGAKRMAPHPPPFRQVSQSMEETSASAPFIPVHSPSASPFPFGGSSGFTTQQASTSSTSIPRNRLLPPMTDESRPVTTSQYSTVSKRAEKSQKMVQEKLRSRKPPVPTSSYLDQASAEPFRVSKPQPLLIVLDLNGTLLMRSKSRAAVTPRPFLQQFLDYCLRNHHVMVWSSATPQSVTKMCKAIFSQEQRQKLVAEWGRNTLALSARDYARQIQVYKRLELVWDDANISKSHPKRANGGVWSQANTVLVDDSIYKAASQPFNQIALPEFDLGAVKGQDARKSIIEKEENMRVLKMVEEYLDEARMWSDVSGYMKRNKLDFEKTLQQRQDCFLEE